MNGAQFRGGRASAAWIWACAIATIILSPTWFLAAHAAIDIADQTLHYAVLYDGRRAGNIAIKIAKTDTERGNGYAVEAELKPRGLAAFFVKARKSTTRFDIDNGEVVLGGGIDDRIDGGDKKSFRVNYAKNRIEFDDRNVAIDSADQFEAVAFPFLLMLRASSASNGLADLAGAKIREVTFTRVRDYVYQSPLSEAVEVAAGKFDAWKITRVREGNANNWVSVWLAKSQFGGAHIPLKIAVAKRERITVFELSKTDGG